MDWQRQSHNGSGGPDAVFIIPAWTLVKVDMYMENYTQLLSFKCFILLSFISSLLKYWTGSSEHVNDSLYYMYTPPSPFGF